MHVQCRDIMYCIADEIRKEAKYDMELVHPLGKLVGIIF